MRWAGPRSEKLLTLRPAESRMHAVEVRWCTSNPTYKVDAAGDIEASDDVEEIILVIAVLE
jgi:hypothetical protein